MAKLQLYLKGAHFQESEIELPNNERAIYDPEDNFETNCFIREEYVQYQSKVLKVNFIKQILKCQNEYEIYLVVRSKMGEENLLEDSII